MKGCERGNDNGTHKGPDELIGYTNGGPGVGVAMTSEGKGATEVPLGATGVTMAGGVGVLAEAGATRGPGETAPLIKDLAAGNG